MIKWKPSLEWFKRAAVTESNSDLTVANPNLLAETKPTEKVQSDGSLYKVPLTTIVNITPHNNAERLELAWVYGFQVIVQKDKYKVGDRVIYVPIDSLLPSWLEDQLFPVDSKIKLHNHRVRQIKIRGLASQGMLIDPMDVSSKVNPEYLKLEQNLAAILGITKYEPPQAGFSQNLGKAKNRNKKHEHPLFHKYNGIDNIKWFPDLFKEGEEVVIEEKLHGTNARASVLPYISNTLWKKIKKFLHLAPKVEKCYGSNTLWKKIKKFLHLAPKVEKCYGSNNVDISAATCYKGFYGEDIYGKCLNDINIFDKLKEGEIIYGEIIGPGIQKNYDYGLTVHRFIVFDAKVLGPDGKFTWLNPEDVEMLCKERGLEFVPILYKGPYNKELAYSMTKGRSVYSEKQKVREGICIKARKEYDVAGNKKALKWVSEDYLDDKSNSDFH